MGFHLADCFERVAATLPTAVAVEDPSGARTFAQLDRRANQAAHLLRSLGVERSASVAVLLPNRVEHLEVLIAAWKLGAIPVNVNTRYTADEIRYVLTNAGVVAAMTDERLAKAVRRALPEIPIVTVASDNGAYERGLSGWPATRPDAERTGSDSYVLYTGGTTGLPKGAVWRHDDIFYGALGGRDIDGNPLVDSLDTLAAFAARDAGTERVFIACPLMHGTAQWMALRTLFRGGTVILDGSPSFDAEATLKRMFEARATALVITGDAFAQPLSQALLEGGVIPTALNVIYSGGARLSPSIARALVDELESVIVVDGYGSTEAGGLGLALYSHGAPDPLGFRVGPDVGVINGDGTPRPVTEAIGHEGQLAFCGRLPVSYLNDPVSTEARFTTVNGRRWYLTGDVGRVESDGTVSVLGRLASSINTGGEKVYPEEVEAALMAHPTIGDAVVFGVPDARFGERIEAAVVLARGTHVPADMDAFLRSRLAGFKMPREIHLVEHVPRTASGKPDRIAARKRS